MRISIAMATFNGARYLQAQLDSFSRQTCLPDELVVSDDDSADASLDIVQRFSETAAFPVRILRNTSRLGYIANFQRALAACSGELIFLSDQDDVWFEGKLAAMSAAMRQDPTAQVLVADMLLADERLRPSRHTQLGNILDAGMPASSFVAGCATVVRREWLELAIPIPGAVATHDNWIHRLALALDVRRVMREPQQTYRRHEDNASMSLASRPEQMSMVRSSLQHGLGDASQAWAEELARVTATRDRIAGAAAVLTRLGLLDRQVACVEALDAQAAAISTRIGNCRSARLPRFPKVLKMWMQGGYRHFSGSRSAIKDMLRP